jgi:hypothetical protein
MFLHWHTDVFVLDCIIPIDESEMIYLCGICFDWIYGKELIAAEGSRAHKIFLARVFT